MPFNTGIGGTSSVVDRAFSLIERTKDVDEVGAEKYGIVFQYHPTTAEEKS